MSCDARRGDQPGRHGHDFDGALQLATPPMCSEELHELAFAVDGLITLSRAGEEMFVETGWQR